MKKIAVILLLLVPVLAYAMPSLTFEAEKHDFGEVKQGILLEHKFEFVNTGDSDLMIERLSPS